MRVRRRNLRNGLVAVGCLVALVAPSGALSSSALPVAGILLLIFGSWLHVWAKGCLEQNEKLVTAGPYRFTRNPFYLANLLIDLGLCCVIGRVWIAVPYIFLWTFVYLDTIRREEERLAALFPGEFERYVTAVPRLIPTGRMLPRSEAAGYFTLANPNLLQGREYARIAGVWVAAATIVAWGWIGRHGLEVFAAENSAGLGLVALVPVAWVSKLALAEVFRSPETALLPLSGRPSGRRLVTFALVAALYLAARILDPSPVTRSASVAFVCMFALIAVLPYATQSPLRRGLLHAGLAASIVVFAASRGVLWCASVPLLWVALAGLDDWAQGRLGGSAPGEHDPASPRTLWPAFRPIALGAIAALALVTLGRTFA